MVQEQRMKFKQKSDAHSQRKAHTQTKIQLGGLLIRSGLAALFEIHVGDNLQDNDVNQEKAAGLYGALEDFVRQLPNPLPAELHQKFTTLGIKAFRTSRNGRRRITSYAFLLN